MATNSFVDRWHPPSLAGLMLLLSLSACDVGGAPEANLLADEAPVKSVTIEAKTNALTAPSVICNPATTCDNCNVNAQVGHILFVHGYSSDQGAFSNWHDIIKPQNDCAGYKTYKVTIGNTGLQTMKYYPNGCNFWECEDKFVQRACTPNAYDPKCIGHCNNYYATQSHAPEGECKGYDRTKNGICAANGYCIASDTDVGATKHLSEWSKDLASFFWNNKLTDLPDRSITIVTHSTGAPAVADFMVRGYDGVASHAIPARKIKRVINIQAALGGACGVSAALNYDDAVSDLDDLQDNDLNYDFKKATFAGAVPWTHIQSFGGTGKTECEGMSVPIASTGDYCNGTAHDGVTNNWHDNTSVQHPNGAANSAGVFANNITVVSPTIGFCHTGGDSFPSYRSDRGRFDFVLGTSPRGIGEVVDPAKYSAWLVPLAMSPLWTD